MKLTKRASLLAAGAVALSFQTAETGDTPSISLEDEYASQKQFPPYQDELKMYLMTSSLQPPKGLNLMEPSSDATSQTNMEALTEFLRDAHLLAALKSSKREVCAGLKAMACAEHFKSVACNHLNLQDLRVTVTEADLRINSTEGTAPSCVQALRHAMILFDLTAITKPLEEFQSNASAGAHSALASLFSALNISASPGRAQPGSHESEESSGSSEAAATKFIEMNVFKRRRNKAHEEATGELMPVPGILETALVGFPRSYLALAGTGGPLASLIFNWLFQAFQRFEELFGDYEGKRRTFPHLRQLLTQGHEHSLTHIYRMCGIILGDRQKSPKLPPNSLFLSREHFKRKSHMTGLLRISCDIMTQALLALYLAEINAVEHINNLGQGLPPEQQEHAAPLEMHAGGKTNFERLCLGFKVRHNNDLLSNLFCAFDETLLGALEANAEGETALTTQTSFMESAQPEDQLVSSRQGQATANHNAMLTFSLLALRGGDHTAVANILGADAGSWWNLILMIDRRTSKEIAQGYTKSLKLCQGQVKKLGHNLETAIDEGVYCSTTWDQKEWEKNFSCQKKLLSLHCAAFQNVYNIFESGMSASIKHFLDFLSKEAACGNGAAKCPKRTVSKQSPLKTIGTHPDLFTTGLRHVPGGENLLRIFILISGNSWKKATELISGNDGVGVIFRGLEELIAARETSVLLSRWLPRSVRKLVKAYMGSKYSKRHLQFLISKLPSNFFMLLRNSIEVLAHPLVFLQLNQLSFTRSELSGERSSSGGLSQRLDSMLVEAATKGLPQKLKDKFKAGAKTTVKDYAGINFAHVEPPKPSTWQEYVKSELQTSLQSWMMYPDNKEQMLNECKGGKPSNVFSLVRDSFDLLSSSGTENLTLIGKVTSPSETSVGSPNRLKRLLTRLMRMPSYRSQHHSFVAVNIDISEVMKAIKTLVDIYFQNKGVFENQQVFMNAAIDLFGQYEQKFKSPSRGLLGVPESTLVPALHPLYSSMPTPDRLRELKESAMSQFFKHIWTLLFSVSANNLLNAAHLDGLEKTFSKDGWQTSINDPYQASSFGMILMGGDLGLKLFNQLLPTTQKRMLLKAKYGSPTVFASQMQLTGSLLSASGQVGLGMFLHAQSVYFGVMISRWIKKRTSDRAREILSWLSLGLFFAASFIQVADGVTQMGSVANETGQASMGGGCPPMGLCINESGDAFVPDPTGSPALTALQVVLKTGVMASIGVFAGPVVAIYNIAVSNFEILSRLEMALGNAVKKIVSLIAKSKSIQSLKKLFKSKQDVETEKEQKAAKTSKPSSASLGDEVEQAVTAFFQGELCHLSITHGANRGTVNAPCLQL